MPIYEYKCKDCGNTFEGLQKFSDPPLSDCPSCFGKAEKMISQCTFHLKGTGWYATDYAKTGGNTGGQEEKTTENKKEDSSSSSATTTPGSKSSATTPSSKSSTTTPGSKSSSSNSKD